LKLNERQIQVERYRFNLTNLLYDVKKAFIFIDHKKVKDSLDNEFAKMLGEKNEEDKRYDQEIQALEELKKTVSLLNKEMDETKKKITDNKAKNNDAEVKNLEEKLKTIKSSITSKEAEADVVKKRLKESEDNIKKQLGKGAVEEPEDEKEMLNKLVARDLKSSLNTKELVEQHLEFLKNVAGGAKILTRFPPEPNGYLHVGHAKAMRFSFTVAKNNGGKCYLRYDDTNPDKETKEYITNIEENVKWLGYEPWKITFASDLFDTLYQFAIVLIKKGKAYVCHQTKADVKEYRKNMMDSPYRNRSVEENLYLFEKMRQGRFAEKEVKI
jgi:glutaminyl-tRNA synthetase